MAVINLYFENTLASGSNFLVMDESAPGSNVNHNTGWNVGKVNPPRYAWIDPNVTVGDQGFTTTVKPDAVSLPDNSLGNGFRSQNTYLGTFPSGTWDFNFRFYYPGGTSMRGRPRIKMFRSSSPTGASAITVQDAVAGSINTVSLSEAAVDFTLNLPQFTLTNEYLFMLFAWEITTAGGNPNDTFMMRQETASPARVTTTNFQVSQTIGSVDLGDLLVAPNSADLSLTLDPYEIEFADSHAIAPVASVETPNSEVEPGPVDITSAGFEVAPEFDNTNEVTQIDPLPQWIVGGYIG